MITSNDLEQLAQSHLRYHYEEVMGEWKAGRLGDDEAQRCLQRLVDLHNRYKKRAAPLHAEYQKLPDLKEKMRAVTEIYDPDRHQLRSEYTLESDESAEELETLTHECEAHHTELNSKISNINNHDIDLSNLQSDLLRKGLGVSLAANHVDIGEMVECQDDLIFSASHPELADKRRELVDLWKRFSFEQREDFMNQMVEKGWDRAKLNELFHYLYLES